MSRLARSGRFAPMKAVAGDLPAVEADWLFEIKWDGMRLLAFVEPDEDGLELRTTNDLDATGRFPALAGLAGATQGLAAVVDGEVVAFDEEGRPSFGHLQRGAVGGAPVALAFQAFDILHLDGRDTMGLTVVERRGLLTEALEPGPTWSIPSHHDEGGALLAAAASRQLEGIVAKRRDSPYLPGRRSSSWRKIKVRRRQEFVVGGWTPGEGRRRGLFGALLVGVHDEHGLRYCGRVGTGFSDAELGRLRERLTPLARPDSPFTGSPAPANRPPPQFVRPEVVVEVTFAEWTTDGQLRHPSYLGERTDKDPRAVVREG